MWAAVDDSVPISHINKTARILDLLQAALLNQIIPFSVRLSESTAMKPLSAENHNITRLTCLFIYEIFPSLCGFTQSLLHSAMPYPAILSSKVCRLDAKCAKIQPSGNFLVSQWGHQSLLFKAFTFLYGHKQPSSCISFLSSAQQTCTGK